MVNPGRAPRGSVLGMWQRATRLLREPDDILLTLRLAHFIWRVPAWLDAESLPRLLQSLGSASRPSAPGVQDSLERVNRLSRPWFQLPWLHDRNTCYLRALMFYRFLDARGQPMRIVFVVEPGHTGNGRLRGHAWVTVGGEIIEAPPGDVVAGARIVYSYPPVQES